jgi:hypothetical protein
MKKGTSSMLTVITIIAILPSTFVYAQTTTTTTSQEQPTTSTSTQSVTPPSAAAQQIINNTKAECQQAQFLQGRCVILVYESPTTVVLNGLIAIFGGSPESRGLHPNPFLWNAVDGFKAQGYTITAVEMNEVSNKSSDNEFHVIMSK